MLNYQKFRFFKFQISKKTIKFSGKISRNRSIPSGTYKASYFCRIRFSPVLRQLVAAPHPLAVQLTTTTHKRATLAHHNKGYSITRVTFSHTTPIATSF